MIAQIIMLVIGIAVGGFATWLILKGKIQSAAEKATATGAVERAGLNATLQAKELQIQGLMAALEKGSAESVRLQTELTTEATKRATVEEKSIRIPTLEAELLQKETSLATLNAEVTKLRFFRFFSGWQGKRVTWAGGRVFRNERGFAPGSWRSCGSPGCRI